MSTCANYDYLKPNIIPGLDFTNQEVNYARQNGKLLSMDLEITEACNGACKYCYRYLAEGPQPPRLDELTLPEIEAVIKLAYHKHGLRRLCILGGEPLIPRIRHKYLGVLNVCNKLGIRHVTFTNGLNLTSKTAKTLRDHGASVCVKLNGMTPEVHDRLVGVPGAFRRAMEGFTHLLTLGYGKHDKDHQIAFETVITRDNYDQIEAMWVWARERGILPYVEKLTVQGRGARHIEELHVDNDDLRGLFERLNQIDRTRYRLDWDVTPPIAGGYHCVRFYMSLYIRANGVVCPCVGVDMHLGNLRQQTISDTLASPLVRVTRNIDVHIKGKCCSCDLSDTCYGCRGAAYQAGDLFAEDPVCWRQCHVNKTVPLERVLSINSRLYPEPVQRTLAIAAAKGIPCEVIEHEQSGCTSEAAAKALGVDIAAVIKTLVIETDQGFAVAIIAGNERLDFKAIAEHLGCRNVRLASPDQVREFSGYDVGGVPPIVFTGKCAVLISRRALTERVVIGAAGDEFYGLKLDPGSIPDARPIAQHPNP